VLLSLFASLKSWGENMGESKAKIIIYLFSIFGVAGVAVGIFLALPLDSITVLLGSIVGLLWIVALNFAYWFILSPATQSRLNFREHLDLSKRRWIAGGLLSIWFLFIAIINSVIMERLTILLGALNVVILVSLARFAVADGQEREEWSESKEIERRGKLFLEAYENGLIDEYGNPLPLSMRVNKNKKKWGMSILSIRKSSQSSISPELLKQMQNTKTQEEYLEYDESLVEESDYFEYEESTENIRILPPEEIRKKNSGRSHPSPPPQF
jgi:hypothetical protein